MKREELTSDVLNELLEYNPDTGKLYWKERSEKWFDDGKKLTAKSKSRIWNGRFSGTEAFVNTSHRGYKKSSILCFHFEAHRVIWCMMTGEWPDQVDHINGVRDDNRWVNLREVDRRGNSRNSKRTSLNTSGVSGVSWCKKKEKWRVRIHDNQSRVIELGFYCEFDYAVEIRKEAEEKYGYHENHGRDS